MLINFYYTLREHKVPATPRELMDLFAAMEKRIAFADMEDFYLLSRTVLVKDEKHYDKFDQAFDKYFKGIEAAGGDWLAKAIPEEWLRKEIEKNLTPEEFEKLKAFGSLDKLMETFRQRLEEQHKRHQGGNKMVGTGGTSPYGGHGENPEGIRLTGESRKKRAVKVWEKREYKNLNDNVELGIRNIKLALRRLRRLTRTGAEEEFDLDETIKSTADNAGLLDIVMRPSRQNKVNVLIFFDVGGSMDPHIKICEELFSAARTEFKHMEYFYFHNFIYEGVWKDNRRRFEQRIPTYDILHRYGKDYRVIVVGDAAMSPYEINAPGGSVEHWNEEPGAVWMKRITDHFDKVVWLNPEPLRSWEYTTTNVWVRQLVSNRMYPLTLKGIEDAMRVLSR
jgi:uncharacterized protein with von Willebrand factor type A (vWA) domain